MRFHFAEGGSLGPDKDDDGVEYDTIDDAIREAACTVLNTGPVNLLEGGVTSLDVYRNRECVATVAVTLTITRKAH